MIESMQNRLSVFCKMVLLISVAVMACNSPASDKKADERDSSSVSPNDTLTQPRINDTAYTAVKDSMAVALRDTSLMKRAEDILVAIKKRDYETISRYIHPELGARFSLYAYVDTSNDRVLRPAEFLGLAKSNKKVLWGEEDAREVSIILTLDQYLKKWVYDRDYLHAEKKAVNKFHGGGNSLNNLRAVYPDDDFVQFYFSGFEEKYGGMDFRGLRLVFRKLNGQSFLIGVIHDEWTI